MKKSELATLVISNTARSDKSTLTSQSLDFALQQLCRIYPFDSLRTEEDIPISSGDFSLQLPKDLFQVLAVRLIDSTATLSYPMVMKRKGEFIQRFPDVAASSITGRPYYCYRERNILYLDRLSDGSYSIRVGYYTLKPFQSDNDVPSVPECDQALIAFATAEVYRSVQMYEDAMYWDRRFKELVNLLVIAEEKEIGTDFRAMEWTREPEVSPNAPWLDPFAGL